MVHKGLRGIGIVVLVGLFGIAGCGGGSSLSKAEYHQKLELVCNKGLQEREEFLTKVGEELAKKGGKSTPRSQAENIRKLVAVYQGTTEEIAEIGVPEQEGKKAEELVQAREEAAKKVDANPLRARAAIGTIFAKATKVGEELEVESCAR